MIEQIVDVGVSFFCQESMSSLVKRLKGMANQRKLLKEISIYLERQFSAKFEDSEINIDFDGLTKYLKEEKAMAFAFASLQSSSQDEREKAKRSLISQAIQKAAATKPEERRAVEYLIDAILSTIQKFYIDQCEPNNLAALNAAVDDITKIVGVENEKILMVLNDLIKQLPGLMEKPIYLISDHECEWDKYDDIPRYVYQVHSSILFKEPESKERLNLWDALQDTRHIVLLGEAGAGKSVALQELYVEASKNGYKPIFLKLKNYPKITGLNLLLESREQLSCEYILILDGLDEIEQHDREEFFKAINDGRRKLYNTRIVITSRLNAYDYQHRKYSQFEDFESYFLLPFTKTEQIHFAERNSVDFGIFMSAIEQQAMQDICLNPFYFAELIKIWKSDNKIPKRSDLMRRIVKRRFDEDARRGYLRKLFENEHKIFKSIDRVAFVMACVKTHEMNNVAYQQVVRSGKTRSDIQRTGFVNRNSDEEWEFCHNIFGEYFAAEMLNDWSKEEVLAFILASNKKLKPSWVNVFAFYCQSCQDEDMLKQVVKNDLDSILQFEDINYSATERTELLINIIEQHEKAETLIKWYYEALRKLVNFVANRESLQYLLDKVAATKAERHTLNVLRVLQHFPKLYDLHDSVEKLVFALATDEGRGEYVCAEAIRALRTLKIFKEDVSAQLVEKYKQSQNWLALGALYFYLVDGGFATSNIAFFLEGIEFFEKRDAIDISTQMILRDGLKCATTIVDLNRIFKYYQQNPNRLRYDQDVDVYGLCCKKAAELYNPETETFIQCFIDSMNEFWHRRNVVDAYKVFIKNTNTESIFISKLLMIKDETHCFLAIEAMLDEVLAKLLIEHYLSDEKEAINVVNWYANRLSGEEKWFSLFDDAIYQKTKIHVKINESFTYQKERKSRMQRYFDALLSPSKYQQIVHDLIDCVGGDVSVGDLHKHFSSYQYWRQADLHECANALRQAFGKDSDILLSECVATLPWEKFAIFNIQQLLNNRNEITLSSKHYNYIEELCLKEIKTIALESVAQYQGNRILYNGYASVILKLMEQQSIKCSQDMFLDMLIVPPELFTQTGGLSIPEYIISNVDFKALSKRITENLENKELQGSVAVTHIIFCLENKLEIGNAFALEYLLGDNTINHNKWSVLQRLYDSRGANFILDTVLFQCNSLELLKAIAGVLKIEEFSPELDQRIVDAYHEDKEGIWYEILIKRGNREALERYRDEAKQKNRIPDLPEDSNNQIGEITMAIGEINRIDVLDILGELLLISYKEDFVDQMDFGLRSRLHYAFLNIAKVDNKKVIEFLEKILSDNRGDEELRHRIIDLLEAIRIPEERIDDSPMTFEDALKLLDS